MEQVMTGKNPYPSPPAPARYSTLGSLLIARSPRVGKRVYPFPAGVSRAERLVVMPAVISMMPDVPAHRPPDVPAVPAMRGADDGVHVSGRRHVDRGERRRGGQRRCRQT